MTNFFTEEAPSAETEEERKLRLAREAALAEAAAIRAADPALTAPAPTQDLLAEPYEVASEGGGQIVATTGAPAPARRPPPRAPAPAAGYAPEGAGSSARFIEEIDYLEPIPAPAEEIVHDYEEEPFLDEQLTPEAFDEAQEFFDEQAEAFLPDEEPEPFTPFLPDDTSFTLPPPPDSVIVPEIPEEPAAPPVPDDYFLDLEAEQQPPTLDGARTEPESGFFLQDEIRRRRTEEATLEGLDFLYLPTGTNEAETDLFDFSIQTGERITAPETTAEPLPDPNAGLYSSSAPVSSLTVDRLAALPLMTDTGFLGTPEEAADLAYTTGFAQDLVGLRDQPPVTAESIRDEIIRTMPDADHAQIDAFLATPAGATLLSEQQQAREEGRRLAQSAIDDVNRGLAIQEARNRALSRLNQRQVQQAEGTPRTIEGVGARGEAITGRVKDNIFTPDRAVLPDEADRILATDPSLYHVERGGAAVSANPLAPVQAAIRTLEDSPAGPLVTGVRWAVNNIGGTALDKTLDMFGYADDRFKELTVLGIENGLLEQIAAFSGGGPIAGRAGLDRALVPKGTAELRQELRQLPMSQKRELAPAIRSVVMTGSVDNLARDLNQGMSAKDAAQKYQNIFVETAAAFVLDPFNAVIPAVNTVRMAKGLLPASGAINLEGGINATALHAMDAVSDAQAVAPWDQMRRFGDVRALRSSDPAAVLGTRGAAARASSARGMADEVATLFELRLAQQAGGSIDELEPIVRSLATQGGDATARQYFNGIAATRAHQNARFVAPELATALDTPSSALRQALDKDVWQGTPEAWQALRRSERPKVYANEREKMAVVLGALQETTNRAARVRFGLDPETDTTIVRAQNAMRGVLSNVYLFNPRYYLRNAAGDQVTALERGFSAWAKPSDMRAYFDQIGRVRTKARAGEFSTLDESRIPVFGPIHARLGDTEAGRWDTTYYHAHRRGWGGRRATAYEDGRENIAGFLDRRTDLDRYARAEVENARNVADLQRLKATPATAPNFKLSGRTVLDDLDDGELQPVLRWQLDRIAQKAARGQNVDADIARLLDQAATHATASTSHLGDLTMRADDWRQLKAEVDALKAGGVPHQQAVTQTLASFGEGRHTNARIAQQWAEVEERLTGKFGREFAREQRALQAKHRDLRDGWAQERGRLRDGALTAAPAERGAAWQRYYDYTTQQRRTIDQTVLGDLDGLVVKMRTAQNGTGFGGAKAAAQYRTVDDMIAASEQRLERLRAAAQPDPRAIRDAEDALANLRGAGRIEHVANPMRGTAAVGASTQSAKDALSILHFQDRLPAAVQDFRTARPVVNNLTAAERRGWNAYIDHQTMRFERDRVAADAMARGQANWILHNYDRTYDYDFWLRWVSPWELWTSRTMAKMPLRVADQPQYFSKVDIFREQMADANSDLPEWLQQKVQIPVPFLPDWMADSLYFDPVKLALPVDLLDTFSRNAEEDTAVGKARALAAFVGMTPGPIADTLLAMVPQRYGGAGLNWWETQTRNPLADVFSAVSAAANTVGIELPIRPIVSEGDRRDARRQLVLMLDAGEISRPQWEQATKDLEENLSLGASLRGEPLQNEVAWRALQRAQGRTAARSWLSLFGVLGGSFEREREEELRQQSAEYGRIRETQGKDAASRYLEEHPNLSAYFGLTDSPAARLQALATSRFYESRDRINQESRQRLEALPLFGTDLDRQQEYDRKDAAVRQMVTDLSAEFPGWTAPEGTARNLPAHLAGVIQAMPVPRDSNGVADFDAYFRQRDEALAALERAPVTTDGMIDTTLAPENLRPAVEQELRPTTVDGATKATIEAIIREGWDGRREAGANVATREGRTRAEAAYEQNWTMPSREEIADRVLREYPELFADGGRFTYATILSALDTSIPATLQQASSVSEAERLQKFRAGLNEQGVSDEPFYANRSAGVVIRTQADLDRLERARSDDQGYRTRRDANDPTFRRFDSEDRAWLFGGEVGGRLWRQEDAVLTQALGPMDPGTGLRDGTKAKGWNSTFTWPNGTKQPAIEAYRAVQRWQTDHWNATHPDDANLPSERGEEAANQTRTSNTTARTGGGTASAVRSSQRAPSRSSYRAPSRSSSYRPTQRTGSSSYRAPARTSTSRDPGPTPPATKWINDAALRADRLAAVDEAGTPVVNLRDEWRKGMGLTPETFDAFVSKHPDVDAGISQMEMLHRSMLSEGADRNGTTAVLQEQALRVTEALEAARATDAERRAGVQLPTIPNLTEQLVTTARVRAGAVDVDRAFRTGSAGLGTPEKWGEFVTRHPGVRDAITQAQAQADALKTEDDAPDDAAAMTAFHETLTRVADQITEARALDREADDQRQQAGAQLREEQRAEMRTFQQGAVVPSLPNINDAWLQPARLRRGATDFDRAFRLGSGTPEANEWTAFLGRNPSIRNSIDQLQRQAGQFVTKAVAPRDAEAMTAFYDEVAAVSALVTAAKEAEAEVKRQQQRVTRRSERIEDDAIIDGGGSDVGYFQAQRARRKKRRDEEEA